ncbi:MAG: glutamate-5-semialdehyde dehydrogenase, partial [Spirochaetales bacterium]|nr:glutamate-5-semialdehyde dehydrogenase [Spirochaetales bacterium]
EQAAEVKKAQVYLGAVSLEIRNKALESISSIMNKHKKAIIQANRQDMKKSEEEKLSAPLLKRLKFEEAKIEEVCSGIDSLIGLSDPVGRTILARELDKDLELFQVSCPIGVIGMIFESRPDALVQIATLCLKSGNGVILKGGSEASNTNRILTELIAEATESAGIPPGWIQLAETRQDVSEMLDMEESIDLLIPRGSNSFVKYIMKNTLIPVMGHADGICHLFVDGSADISMAVELTDDSKTQYVAVCNALETLLVDRSVAEKFLPLMKKRLESKNVELRGCEKTRNIIDVSPATEEDWSTEYLDYILSVKVVDSLDNAIEHINRYGSGHTDVIVSSDTGKAEKFMNLVDSADVFWNCSTRFSDGFRYGLGAEVGVSTNKIHARGPVGLEGLVIYKWRLKGNGHKVEDYSSGRNKFTHKIINKEYKSLK